MALDKKRIQTQLFGGIKKEAEQKARFEKQKPIGGQPLEFNEDEAGLAFRSTICIPNALRDSCDSLSKRIMRKRSKSGRGVKESERITVNRVLIACTETLMPFLKQLDQREIHAHEDLSARIKGAALPGDRELEWLTEVVSEVNQARLQHGDTGRVLPTGAVLTAILSVVHELSEGTTFDDVRSEHELVEKFRTVLRPPSEESNPKSPAKKSTKAR